MYNVVMSSVTSPAACNNQQVTSRPPSPVNSIALSACYQTLPAAVSFQSDDDNVNPMYVNYDNERRSATTCDDYKAPMMPPPLPPLYTAHHLYPSISAYQHHHQQQHQQHANSYANVQLVPAEHSSGQGMSGCLAEK